MFALRIARQQPKFLAPSTRAPALVSISKRFNSSDYGSGEHNNLKRSKSELEHPGPAPPSTGNKKSSGSSQPESGSESGSQKKEDGGKPKPKILSDSPPKESEQPEDVKKHNEEMKERADRPMEGRKD